MKVEVYFVLTYLNGEYVALDANSGGYPYGTSNILRAKLWDNKEEALKYPIKGETFNLQEVIISIGPDGNY